MRILIGWDNQQDAELIGLYLNNVDHTAEIEFDRPSLVRNATHDGPWDVILLAIDFPDADAAFQTFEELHRKLPTTPIIGACKVDQMVSVVRFLAAGMRTYLLRDAGGDFVFLLLAALQSAVNSVQAERDQQIAEKLREEVDSVRKFEQALIGDRLYCPAGYVTAGKYEASGIRIDGEAPVVLAGGDFYDVFPIDKSRVGILMADAAGHGMQACLSITILQTHLQMLQQNKIRSVSEFVGDLNRRFGSHRIVKRRGNLASMLFGILHTGRHTLTWTSAGHPIPLLDNRQTGQVAPIGQSTNTGPPLGVDGDFAYRALETALPPRSRTLFYTDGLTEASPDEISGEQFGVSGVRNTLFRVSERQADEVVRALLNDSHAYTRGKGRHDDTSVLVLERN